jgi:peptidoglycan/LPS O-acetylase OafA/YrhL
LFVRPIASPVSGRRTDIQALRAFAVAAVVLYHLWPARLPGGFAGVDMFFVVSGFLITGQLAGELDRTGSVSLTAFWARRIRRLLPAALFTLIACTVGLFALMPRLTWPENLLEIRAAAAYVENWLLGAHAVDYLAQGNDPSLVQHYWSLSVEEQFYVGWPLLLLVVLFVGRRLTTVGRRRLLLGGLAVVGAASFAYSIAATAADGQTAFFSTPTRAWEFAAGGVVALLPARGRHPRASAARPLLAWLGVGLLALTLVLIDGSDPFPGWRAALPVAGAAAVLATDTSTGRWSPTRPLRIRPVQWLGGISYALYLWHWPLIIAAPWVLHEPVPASGKVVLLGAAVVLADLTTRLVEAPVRHGRWWRSRRWPAYALATAGVGAVVIAASLSYGHVQRVNHRLLARAAAAQSAAESAAESGAALPAAAAPPTASGSSSSPHAAAGSSPPTRTEVSCWGAGAIVNAGRCPEPYARPAGLDPALAADDGRTYECLQPADSYDTSWCTVGATRSPSRTIAVVGNSHARRLVPALDLYGRSHGWQVIVATKINCMGLTTTALGSFGADDPCVRWSAAIEQRLLALPRLDAVIDASFYDARPFLIGQDGTDADLATARTRILQLWSEFARQGTRVIVPEDVPGMRPKADPDCLALSRDTNDPCAVPRSSVVHGNVMTTLARQHPELASYLPMSQYFCDARTCHALIGGVVVYFDDNHITDTYSRSLAPYLGAEISGVLPEK